jgi:GNAT superfamily N-acetyltransferase
VGVPQGLIRRARPEDVPEILAMVRDLAAYERAVHEAVATPAQFHAALFGDSPKVFAHVVEHAGPDGQALGGFALWFLNFSTWLGRHGLYLEDLYVRPELRGSGYGKRLLGTLAQECVTNDYGRLEWWVLDWNEPALGFYGNLGAVPMDEWTVHRVTGEDLRRLAGPSGSSNEDQQSA